jgi:hypothetical protein
MGEIFKSEHISAAALKWNFLLLLFFSCSNNDNNQTTDMPINSKICGRDDDGKLWQASGSSKTLTAR